MHRLPVYIYINHIIETTFSIYRYSQQVHTVHSNEHFAVISGYLFWSYTFTMVWYMQQNSLQAIYIIILNPLWWHARQTEISNYKSVVYCKCLAIAARAAASFRHDQYIVSNHRHVYGQIHQKFSEITKEIT